MQHDTGEEELCSVYVPTNHLYIGDIVLLNTKDIIRPNLSVREGIGWLLIIVLILIKNLVVKNINKIINNIVRGKNDLQFLHVFLYAEIVLSGGMTMPQHIYPLQQP